MQPYTKFQNIALLAMRIVVAAIFFYAGYAKWFIWSGAPEGMSAWLAIVFKLLAIVEPLGAAAILAGFLTRWAAGGLAVIMAGAIFVMQFIMRIGFAAPTGAGWNFPFAVLAGCVVLMAFGAGRWSVDAMRKKSAT